MSNLLNIPIVAGQVVITSPFGSRTNPLTGRTERHNGVDFAPRPRGNPKIYALADGQVILQQQNNLGAGNWIEILHDKGTVATYMHMDTMVSLPAGTRVSRGQHIGTMGTTGASTGVHLHFELRHTRARNNGLNAVDPMPYLKEDIMQLQTQNWRINGQAHQLQGVTINDRRLTGGRQLAEALGAVVGWDPETSTSTADMPGIEAGKASNIAAQLSGVSADQWRRIEAIIRE